MESENRAVNDAYLDLDEYRGLIDLDEPFVVLDQTPMPESEQAAVVDELTAFLESEEAAGPGSNTRDVPVYEKKRDLLRALLTIRDPHPLPAGLLEKFDRLLSLEAKGRGITDAHILPPFSRTVSGTTYRSSGACALWRGDITTLGADAIVNAANAEMLGCFMPFHACIDNIIHAIAGPRLREDCHAIMRRQGCPEGTGLAKITRGYNLPARFVLHTVGPIVRGDGISAEQEEELSACYEVCLDLACRMSSIKSVAFCCISTGVFGFPQEPAARIALQTVDNWLSLNPGALEQVIFNVYRRDDQEIYERLLREW